jgi:hypothetical protein
MLQGRWYRYREHYANRIDLAFVKAYKRLANVVWMVKTVSDVGVKRTGWKTQAASSLQL